MPRTILRHKQRAVTAVTPAPSQGRWINPNKALRIPLLQPVFFFAVDSFAESVLTTTFNAGVVWEFHCRLRADVAAGSNQIILATDNVDFRVLRDSGGSLSMTLNAATVSFAPNVILNTDDVYTIVVKGDGIGNATATVHNDDDNTEQIGQATLLGTAAGVASTVHLSNSPAGTADFIGPITNIVWFESGVIKYNWPMHEGDPSTTFFDAGPNGVDLILTPGAGVWSDA